MASAPRKLLLQEAPVPVALGGQESLTLIAHKLLISAILRHSPNGGRRGRRGLGPILGPRGARHRFGGDVPGPWRLTAPDPHCPAPRACGDLTPLALARGFFSL